MKLIITTSTQPNNQVLDRANQWAEELNCPLVIRSETAQQHLSLAQIATTYQAELVVVVGRKQTKLWMNGKEYYYHPNMAKLRLLALAQGQVDQLIQAAQIKAGNSLLDCTLGLAADAIVASFAVGLAGKIVGLESQELIASLTSEGLRQYQAKYPALVDAMRRIQVVKAEASSYLASLPDETFDIVYFDPMFPHTKQKSSGIDLLRICGNPAPLTKQILQEGLRVAKQRVVVKHNRASKLFEQLGITLVVGGKYSSVAYGVLEKHSD